MPSLYMKFGFVLMLFVSVMCRADPADTTSFEIARFFPLQVGAFWTYKYSGDVPATKSKMVAKVPLSAVTINGAPATLLDEWRYGWQASHTAESLTLVTNDGNGIYFYDGCFNPPAYQFLPAVVTVGETYTSEAACNNDASTKHSVTVDGFEPITVSGLVFQALKVSASDILTYMNAASTVSQVTSQGPQWYVIDIGLVKAERTYTTSLTVPPYSVRMHVTKEIGYSTSVDDEQKDDGCAECSVGNPINYGNGNKFQAEVDYGAVRPFGLHFHRFYNSHGPGRTSLGTGWRHNYESSILPILDASPPTVLVTRASGKAFAFVWSNGVWTTDADVSDRLEAAATDASGYVTKWRYTTANDEVETYDQSGKLISVANRARFTHTVTYQPNSSLIAAVTDSQGRKLGFTYNTSTGLLAKITDPAQRSISFTYDAAGNLTKVTYQDGTTRTYRYNESNYTGGTHLPHALTSLVDENGAVYASWHYDSQGRAVSSEHANGAEKVVVAYGDSGAVNITDSLNKTRTFNVQKILRVSKNTSLSEACPSCNDGRTAQKAYDTNGNVTSRIDFNENKTCYAYDVARNLEIRRIEGLSSNADCGNGAMAGGARTVTTEWHPAYRLPTRIAEPKRITTLAYDSSGNLLSKTVRATTDADGSQGFGAAAVGSPRIWSYTYNQYGQVLTATGPRTDIADITTYTYDNKGNVTTVTNAVNQVTTLSNHDANGRVGRITDPNGLVAELTYHPRGWLSSKKVGNELTGYEYDGVGQLKKVTLPDGSFVSYAYDDAHRLTAVADSLGNRIEYTLDAMGNSTSEKVRDPNGTLARQTTRVYDALNRLQEITGGVQ